MAYKALPPQGVLRQLLDYNPDTGVLTWRAHGASDNPSGRLTPEHHARMQNGRFAGKEAFITLTRKGYKVGAIKGARYFAHRIIWKWVTGEDPEFQIDHINGQKDDNRLSNLRVAAQHENDWNRAKRRGLTSKFKGVSVIPATGSVVAGLKINGRRKHLGTFMSEIDAAKAYDAAAKEHFGEFARLNFPQGA